MVEETARVALVLSPYIEKSGGGLVADLYRRLVREGGLRASETYVDGTEDEIMRRVKDGEFDMAVGCFAPAPTDGVRYTRPVLFNRVGVAYVDQDKYVVPRIFYNTFRRHFLPLASIFILFSIMIGAIIYLFITPRGTGQKSQHSVYHTISTILGQSGYLNEKYSDRLYNDRRTVRWLRYAAMIALAVLLFYINSYLHATVSTSLIYSENTFSKSSMHLDRYAGKRILVRNTRSLANAWPLPTETGGGFHDIYEKYVADTESYAGFEGYYDELVLLKRRIKDLRIFSERAYAPSCFAFADTPAGRALGDRIDGLLTSAQWPLSRADICARYALKAQCV